MITLEIAVGVAGALLLCFGLWFLWLRKYLEWQNLTTLDIKERVGLKIEFVKTAAQIVGGLFFILTILVAYRNYQVSQKNLELAKDKEVTELYVKAIGQLGSDKLPVVLGGIYALERIARDSEKDHGPIMEVLTAYVREKAPWTPEKEAEAKEPPAESGKLALGLKKPETKPAPEIIRPPTDIQAILTVLGRRTRIYKKEGDQRLNLRKTDLRGADLHEAHLEGAILWEAHLERAYLFKAHLEGAYLEEGHLEGADLRKAHLEGAGLQYAHLEGAYLEEGHLERAKLFYAQMNGAILWEARLEGADLRRALLEGAVLRETHLEGADLRGAEGLTKGQIDLAYCDDKTELPPGVKRSSKKKPVP